MAPYGFRCGWESHHSEMQRNAFGGQIRVLVDATGRVHICEVIYDRLAERATNYELGSK